LKSILKKIGIRIIIILYKVLLYSIILQSRSPSPTRTYPKVDADYLDFGHEQQNQGHGPPPQSQPSYQSNYNPQYQASRQNNQGDSNNYWYAIYYVLC
jgi:hypothetical protein